MRDGGATALRLAEAVQETLAALEVEGAVAGADYTPGLGVMQAQLSLALEAYRGAVQYVLENAQSDIRAVYTGSVPYLMLSGYVL